ncbi:hypothetical protein PAPYR_7366 [Paratrimastix pyriformis]|uniref:Uncharacterized protein n=1 Tax=Paratrimastix pyriformis TaxID=342808 RepID=A0ABQ8UKA0_9EUKA|nr:hypothetical protein PAPYR_7366 [Paratrimastix pyriformis]
MKNAVFMMRSLLMNWTKVRLFPNCTHHGLLLQKIDQSEAILHTLTERVQQYEASTRPAGVRDGAIVTRRADGGLTTTAGDGAATSTTVGGVDLFLFRLVNDGIRPCTTDSDGNSVISRSPRLISL